MSKIVRGKNLLQSRYPIFVGSVARPGGSVAAVVDKFTNKDACQYGLATRAELNEGIELASQAKPAMKALTSYTRKAILQSVASSITARADELAYAITVEVGKPIRDSITEVGRAIDTFTVAAEEAVRNNGDFLRLDISARNKGFNGIVTRFPIGVVSMVAPFNFPLNLAAHKVAPAIAAGCPFVLKPSDRTPITAAILGDILSKTPELPKGAFSVMPCALDDARIYSEDPRFDVLSFTGSPKVGWQLKNQAGRKKVLLELGGNAACVVDKDADVAVAVDRITFGAYYSQGQSCISVQRVYVHDSIYERVRDGIAAAIPKLVKGDPMLPEVFMGPMISEFDAKRCETWVREAVAAGARVVAGGKREGTFYDPTLVENVPTTAKLSCQEVFGPVCIIEPFSDFKAAIKKVNDSEFGLQGGIFTNNMHHAFYAYEHIDAGGVVINEVPAARVDSQPYGGIKSSGVGREGLRYAIEEFQEMKIMLMKNIGQL